MTRRGLFAMLGAALAPKRALSWFRAPASPSKRIQHAGVQFERALIVTMVHDPNRTWVECFLPDERRVLAVVVNWGIWIPALSDKQEFRWPDWGAEVLAYRQEGQGLYLIVPRVCVNPASVPVVEVVYAVPVPWPVPWKTGTLNDHCMFKERL